MRQAGHEIAEKCSKIVPSVAPFILLRSLGLQLEILHGSVPAATFNMSLPTIHAQSATPLSEGVYTYNECAVLAVAVEREQRALTLQSGAL